MARWFRCYSDVKDDPKMLGLSDTEFRIWIHLLALVSEEGTDGTLPTFTEKGIASSLRTTVPKWRSALALFAGIGMVSVEPLTITNWSKRQYTSDNSTERSRRSRNGNATLQQRPQSQSQITESETTTGTTARERYFRAFGHEGTDDQITSLENSIAVHPPDCVEWVFHEVAGSQRPGYGLARFLFNECALGHKPHGPRVKEKSSAAHTRSGQGHPAAAERSGKVRGPAVW